MPYKNGKGIMYLISRKIEFQFSFQAEKVFFSAKSHFSFLFGVFLGFLWTLIHWTLTHFTLASDTLNTSTLSSGILDSDTLNTVNKLRHSSYLHKKLCTQTPCRLWQVEQYLHSESCIFLGSIFCNV